MYTCVWMQRLPACKLSSIYYIHDEVSLLPVCTTLQNSGLGQILVQVLLHFQCKWWICQLSRVVTNMTLFAEVDLTDLATIHCLLSLLLHQMPLASLCLCAHVFGGISRHVLVCNWTHMTWLCFPLAEASYHSRRRLYSKFWLRVHLPFILPMCNFLVYNVSIDNSTVHKN